MRISNFSPSVFFDAAILHFIGPGGLEVGGGTARNESGIFTTINFNCFLVSFFAPLHCKRLFLAQKLLYFMNSALKKKKNVAKILGLMKKNLEGLTTLFS